MILILMGVSGSGKSTIGHMLSDKFHWTFEDGDDFHPPSNKKKMSSGVPLNDTDRYQWLLNLNAIIRRWHSSKQHGIIVCSALKLKYRRVLVTGQNTEYFDADVSLNSDPHEGCSQEKRTAVELTSDFHGPGTEMKEPCISKDQDHVPQQTISSTTAPIQGAIPSLQKEQNHYVDNNHHSCDTRGHQPPQVLFIHLKGTMDLISSRLSQRKGHFFNPRLLQSQFDTLEELGADEEGFVVDINDSSDSIVSKIAAHVLPLLPEHI